VAIFTPIYLGVVIPGRWFIRHRANRQGKAFVSGASPTAGAITAAVTVLARQAILDRKTALIATSALILLRSPAFGCNHGKPAHQKRSICAPRRCSAISRPSARIRRSGTTITSVLVALRDRLGGLTVR
jgi:hypothetical protein